MTERYIDYVSRIRRYSAETCETYRRILDEYSEFVSELPEADRFSVTTVRNYEVYLLRERCLSARSVSLHLSVLSGYCRFLMREGVLQANPVHLVTRPRQEKRLPEFYRRESLESYFSTHRGVLEFGSYEQKLQYMTISLLYGCGIRRSELISLDVNSVDLSRRVLRVRGKGDKMREIPLTPTVCQEISLYLQSADSKFGSADADGTPLLRTASGARLYPVLVDRFVKHELEGVEGITGRRSPHVLRHTLATELLGDGTDLNSIKELLGHSSLAATQVYTHNSVERLKTVYNQAHPRAKKNVENGD
ncbi:MAG: tyrosine-type recombinase/integrase [Bacteroidales bacterium]|nr:tyrosine-type recombinase/integrase [Bacteroidales bacterium]